MCFYTGKERFTQGHTSSRGIVVNPEGDPGQDCDQGGGHVRLQDKVAYVSLMRKLNDSRGYEPGETQVHSRSQKREMSTCKWKHKRASTGKNRSTICNCQSLHLTTDSHFPICSDGAFNFPKAMDSFPGTSSVPINMAESRKHGRFSETPSQQAASMSL